MMTSSAARNDSDDEESLLAGSSHQRRLEGEEDDGEEEEELELAYYRQSRVANTMTKALLACNWLAVLSMYVVLCVDFYWECDNEWTVDNLCFFGTFRVFGSYANNSHAFFIVWPAIVVLATLTSAAAQSTGGVMDLWTLVRVTAAAEDGADVVRVFLPSSSTADSSSSSSSSSSSFAVTVKRQLAVKANAGLRAIGLISHNVPPLGRYVMCDIQRSGGDFLYFELETVRYCARTGRKVQSLKLPRCVADSPSAVLALFQGVAVVEDEEQRRSECGPNAIPFRPPTLMQLVRQEFTSPFYAYQLTIYLIWIYWTYWFVGLVLLSLVLGSGLGQVWLKHRALTEAAQLTHHADSVRVRQRQGGVFVLHSTAEALMPSDVVCVESRSWTVPADLILCQGTCAVDESGLTGESMPRSKTADGTNVLYAGTRVLDCSPDAQAVVLAIGSASSRGKLLAQVLFPPAWQSPFDEEFSVAALLLLAYAALALVLSIYLQHYGTSSTTTTWTTVLSYGIMTVSQVLSPMLKLALQAGRVAATARLRAKHIACMDQDRLDVCGRVDVFCFDKTGTLTEPAGLRMLGVALPGEEEVRPVCAPEHALLCATCHSLSKFNGKLLGPSVEAEMFSTSSDGWDMINENVYHQQGRGGRGRAEVRQRFGFCQVRRTMSVVVDVDKTETWVFCKGAPESLAKRCLGEDSSRRILFPAQRLSAQGCYVLAMAGKRVVKQQSHGGGLSRDEDVERDLDYMGLLVFRNELKPDAQLAIGELKRAGVRPVMITGDNLDCALFVCQQVGMASSVAEIGVGSLKSGGGGGGGCVEWTAGASSELAVTGDVFDWLQSQGELATVLPAIRVFARMSPAQKVAAVQAIKHLMGKTCAMAGDGGNDSGALRAAHVGLSYASSSSSSSTTETTSSVVAPFVSSEERVMACVDLVIEGRAALRTSIATYKFLVVYGLVFSVVKFASFYYGVLMSLAGYILIDLVGTVPLTYYMTTGGSLARLPPRAEAKDKKQGLLLGWETVVSIVGAWVGVMVALGVNLGWLMGGHEDYVRWPKHVSNSAAWWVISDNWEAATIFHTCFVLFSWTAVVFSLGGGARAPLYDNKALLGTWLGLFVVATLVFLPPTASTSVVRAMAFWFHGADEQFNRQADTLDNPVWAAYQAGGGGSPSPAMPWLLRAEIWLVNVGCMLGMLAWEYFVVLGKKSK